MIELYIEAEDSERLLWECRIWSKDDEFNKHVIGGDSKVSLLDGDRGLIKLIMKKIDRIWPDDPQLKLVHCKVKEDAPAAEYLRNTIKGLLKERRHKLKADKVLEGIDKLKL